MSNVDVKVIAARADLCRLVAACYYEPGPEFAEEKVFDAMRIAAADALPSVVPLVESMASDFAERPLEALQVDYTALFLKPDGALAAPYQSAWLAGGDPMLAEQALDAVTSFYAEAGFEIGQDFPDLPDHIAAELELLYALLFREARATAINDSADAEKAAELRQRFVAVHLGRWIGDFARAMRAGAQTEFYRSLADLTERFVRAQAE